MASVNVADDPELTSEQEYLNFAHQSLGAMRQRAEGLLNELRTAGQPDLDYQAALLHRVAVLADSPRPLLFGRIDEEAGPSWHIGRRHVEDLLGDPVVVDWRAPISMPFYQARVERPLGLTRRRQVMVDRQQVVAVADDLFDRGSGHLSGTRLRGGDALLAELERARTGEMLDIVATIQVEQDEIIRAPLDMLIAVQGGPGTGKTAVGLHRAAFLLYNHPSLSQDGVLVLGPSRAFLRYIAQVLPSLGEEAVMQTTLVDIAPRVKVRATDDGQVRRLKGDARMGLVIGRALAHRRQPIEHEVTLRARFTRCTLSAEVINGIVQGITSTRTPYKAGRLALRQRLVSTVRQQLRSAGRFEADEPWLERELTSADGFKDLIDRLWPSISPVALVSDLLTNAERLKECASGILDGDEWPLLLRRKGKGLRTQGWAIDDLALLDEADALISGKSRTYGHIVVDEAQDLSPMQFKMLARRAPHGSITVLGDLAQATGPWSYNQWSEILQYLPEVAPVRQDELTLGYRAPGQVLDFASRLLPEAAPMVNPTHSIRRGRSEPRIRLVEETELNARSLIEAEGLAAEGYLVGLVTADHRIAAMTAEVRDRVDVGVLEEDGMERKVTVVAASAVKGLEFDAVVVVEPADIAGTDIRGLRLLYIAMTRPIQHLSIVHAKALPSALSGDHAVIA
jgi:DNA helicase IV